MRSVGRSLSFAALACVALAAGAQPSAPSEEARRAEIVFWETIRSSTDPADFRAYLEQYPGGKFAPLARNRLAALERKPAAAPATEPAPAVAASRPLPQKG